MSIEVMRYVWKHSKSKANARLMLLAIADIANDNGDAYPGVDKLGAKCNISRRCAQDVIQELERLGELFVYENVGTKTISGWTNLYRVILEGVNQGVIRNPKGEPASPRTAKNKKSKQFPKDVQTDAPLKDVQPSAPDAMQTDAPHDVQPSAPKSSEDSPGDTSDNTLKAPKKSERHYFEAVAKGAFELTNFKGLSKESANRIGLLEKSAKTLVIAYFPTITDEQGALLVSKYCSGEKFKPNLQGKPKFELGFGAWLEKNAKHVPAFLAQQPAPVIIEDDATEFVDPEEVKRVLAETMAGMKAAAKAKVSA